jgi:CheY-like chemotaxis protein
MTPHTILSVDDSPDDLMLLMLSCGAMQVCFQLQTVDSGERALAYLQGTGPFADRAKFPWPVLVILDLKMPAINGFDVLAWIRSHEQTAQLPVVIFTASSHPEDRQRAMEMGATRYAVKPVSWEGIQEFVRSLDALLLERTRAGSTRETQRD